MNLQKTLGLIVILGATSVAGAAKYSFNTSGTLGTGLPDVLGIDGADFTFSIQFNDNGVPQPGTYNNGELDFYAVTNYPVEQISLTISGATNPLNNGSFTIASPGHVQFSSYYGYGYGTQAVYETNQSFGLNGVTGNNGYTTNIVVNLPDLYIPPGSETGVPVMPFSATTGTFQLLRFPPSGTFFSYRDDFSTALVEVVPEPTTIAAIASVGMLVMRRSLKAASLF